MRRQALRPYLIARAVCSATLVLASACANEHPLDETAPVARAILGGTVINPHPRPEIGSFGGCTATMIRPNWILAAAHCWGYFDGRDPAGVDAMPTFSTTSDGQFPSAGGQTVKVDRTFSFSSRFHTLGRGDVLLARLESTPTAPPGIVPAQIAESPPFLGRTTIWGAGCTDRATREGSGVMRAVELLVFEPYAPLTPGYSNRLCKGDSGGPKVVGGIFDRGPIFAINSAFGAGDAFGDPVAFRSQIIALMDEWDANGSGDIFGNNWCTHPGTRRHFIDWNGDREPDALCHDSNTGMRWLAESRHRLIRQIGFDSSAWCRRPGQEAYTGDFDGDGRTDLLCHAKSGPFDTIDFPLDGYDGGDVILPLEHWCSHPSAQLHVGDIDGDGRSDLLCHDTSTGMKWVDLAAHTGRVFVGTSDLVFTSNFCSHAGAKLLLGDTNGDGRSDLICHTPSTGDLHLDVNGAGFFAGTDFALGPDPATARRFCTDGRLEVADYDGDGRSDLRCERPSGMSFPSLYANTDGTYAWVTPLVEDFHEFGYGGEEAPRTLRAASQPWVWAR